MKKVLCVLLALVAVPAMAATFTLGTPDTSVAGKVTIPWSADAGVVGIGLKVDVTGGTASSVQVTPTSFFDVFLDSAYSIGETYTIGQGVPTATQGVAGQLPLSPTPQASFSICVGGLDDDGIGAGTEEAPLSGNIVIQGTPGAAVVISEDTLRGGVVGYAGAMTLAGLPKTTAFGAPSECVKSTAPFYNDWVALGKPNCWCYARNCRGDADGLKVGSALAGYSYVTTADLNVLIAAWNVKEPPKGLGIATIPNGICADFSRDKVGSALAGYARVTTSDLNKLIAYWNVKEAPKGVGIPDCGTADYNFFVNP